MKNIVHEIIYDEQNYTSSNTKTQQSIIPLLGWKHAKVYQKSNPPG